MARYRGNAGSIGTGNHLEKHYYKSSIADKKICLYYDEKIRTVSKLGYSV